MSAPLRLLSWNIHGAVGADKRCDRERIVALIREMDAHVVALQEVDGRQWLGRAPNSFEFFREALDGEAVEARMFGRPGAEHGNLLASRLPLAASRVHRLPGGWESRGLIEARLETGFGPLCVFATHFSLGPPARRRQAAEAARIAAEAGGPAVIVGDLNEWHPRGPVHRRLDAVLPVSLRPRTWPARRPVVAMDRLYADRRLRVRQLDVPAEAAAASDHLPLLVEIDLENSI